MIKSIFFLLFLVFSFTITAQSSNDLTHKVNVFLGTSGDHGQMSPSASSPFNMLSIGPQTRPHIHTGYEHYAKEFMGFTHTRIEGVGCTGSGGNILIKPILDQNKDTELLKDKEEGHPGFYRVSFQNGIEAQMGVDHNFGIEKYRFPKGKKGLYIDLSYAFVNRFVAEQHAVEDGLITGWVDTQTTCSRGIYRIYYALKINNLASLQPEGEHAFFAMGDNNTNTMEVRIAFSSVDTTYAKKRLEDTTLENLKEKTKQQWNDLLGHVEVNGETDRENLFYSLLYRGLQAPYLISEPDGTYRAIDGTVQQSKHDIYNGWAIWDNYREQLPMLSLIYPQHFGNIAKSIANLYRFGKNDWATQHEPSPTVRTEHAMVVLLDARKKGYEIDLKSIKDSLLNEAAHLDYGAPDKALESSYDSWAMSEILKITGDSVHAKKFRDQALEYKKYWLKDFADLTKNDIDRMQARGLYQGTIWQYRWFVPFDVAGLKQLAGGEDAFINQLDRFFKEDDYNHANQPDLQVPGLYNATSEPWKSQKLYRNILLDTVVQNYFNDNSKGVDPYVGRIYNNRPKAYLRTMDDDAGTMSSWFVMRSIGLSPANIGNPIYYLTAPIFKEVQLKWPDGKVFGIKVENYDKTHFYVQSAVLNGKALERNWLTQVELRKGGELLLKTSAKPNKAWGVKNQWISSMAKQ